MAFDFERTAMLLHIVEKVSVVAPGYTHITAEAMAELRQMNEDLRKAKEEQQGRSPTPASYGDSDSPAPLSGAESPETNPVLEPHPTASAPVEGETHEEGE